MQILVHIAQQHENTHTVDSLLSTAMDARTHPAIPAAKAIFVKTYGLAAYYKTTDLVGCADKAPAR